jgi:hypothetical protein
MTKTRLRELLARPDTASGIRAFLSAVERYQHHSEGNRERMRSAWRTLPEDFRRAIAATPALTKRLWRGDEGRSTAAACSWSSSRSAASLFGRYVFPFSDLSAFEGTIDTAKMGALTRIRELREFDIGDDEGEVIVLSQQWKAPRSNPKTARRTHPSLWSRIVAEVTASAKGGLPGQWSARKAQFAVAEYQRRGGGYIGPKSSDNALAKWTREQWRTRSGLPSLVTGERYLPAKALAALSPQEYGATTRAKRAGMAAGEQFVPQPERIAMKTARFRRNPDWPDAGFGSAKYGHTTVSWAVKGPKEVDVYSIRTPVKSRRKGSARGAMVAFLEEADRRGLAVTLLASPLDKATSLPRLVQFYQSLGFVLTGRSGNAAGHPLMRREPHRLNPRARRNPNYDDVSVYRGVLTSPEGRIPVKQIGKGQFSVAYLSSEPRPRVFLFTSEAVQDKEILMFAHDRLPNNPHLPAVEAYGDTRDGKTVWTMPLYKAPLKKADNETAWKQYLALKKCRANLYKPRGVKSGYEVNYDVYECAIAAGVSPKLANALEHLLNTAADYDEEYVFEFSPRNLATDAEGNLVLLDVLYHRAALFRKLGAAAARGF